MPLRKIKYGHDIKKFVNFLIVFKKRIRIAIVKKKKKKDNSTVIIQKNILIYRKQTLKFWGVKCQEVCK